jgi:hypothetical protein
VRKERMSTFKTQPWPRAVELGPLKIGSDHGEVVRHACCWGRWHYDSCVQGGLDEHMEQGGIAFKDA